MKVIRQITFLVSLIIMMGHDLVPHIHEIDETIVANRAVHDALCNGESPILWLKHSLSHYQHNSVVKTSELSINFIKKNQSLKNVAAVSNTLYVDNGVVSYSNLKKQKIWEQHFFIASLLDTSQSQRGPPSC